MAVREYLPIKEPDFLFTATEFGNSCADETYVPLEDLNTVLTRTFYHY